MSNKVLYGLSALQLAVVIGIGYGLYRAGQTAEREYLKIKSDANLIVQQAPDVIAQLQSLQPTINSLESGMNTALSTLQRIESRLQT
jgi:hypothetical protein